MQPNRPQDWDEADDLLMGSKVRSAMWGAPKQVPGSTEPPDKTPGYIERGMVTEKPRTRQQTGAPGTPQAGELLWWDDEKTQPKKQVVIKIQTDAHEDDSDDGIRAIYVKGGVLQAAIQKAVRDAGRQRIEVGGILAVKFIKKIYENGQYKNLWAAQYSYTAPEEQAADDFFGDSNATVATPQQPAQDADQARNTMLERMKTQQATGLANLPGRSLPANPGFEDEPPF